MRKKWKGRNKKVRLRGIVKTFFEYLFNEGDARDGGWVRDATFSRPLLPVKNPLRGGSARRGKRKKRKKGSLAATKVSAVGHSRANLAVIAFRVISSWFSFVFARLACRCWLISHSPLSCTFVRHAISFSREERGDCFELGKVVGNKSFTFAIFNVIWALASTIPANKRRRNGRRLSVVEESVEEKRESPLKNTVARDSVFNERKNGINMPEKFIPAGNKVPQLCRVTPKYYMRCIRKYKLARLSFANLNEREVSPRIYEARKYSFISRLSP